MKILMISQVFWPDTASVAQHLGDLAEILQKNQHSIDVYTSRNDYENTSVKFLPAEIHNGIRIERIRHTAFGKGNVIGRLSDFFSFNCMLFLKLLTIKKKKYDLIFGTTSPPLVSYLGVKIARWKDIPFCYWTMDLQPELAIVSGMIKENAPFTKMLTYMGNYTMKHSNLIFTLDRFMKEHLIKRGASPGVIHVLPVWPVMDSVYEGNRNLNPFRVQNNFGDKIVIMYSGNHSYIHPIDTLLEAALNLKENDRFLFVFVGGGIRKKDVTSFGQRHSLKNLVQLPYQPRNNIHNSLGAADIQVVIMGSGQIGFTHPNKVYGAMFIGKPILYIGPSPSHITDILFQLDGNLIVDHGESTILTSELVRFGKLSEEERQVIGLQNRHYAQKHFSPEKLKSKMVNILQEDNNT